MYFSALIISDNCRKKIEKELFYEGFINVLQSEHFSIDLIGQTEDSGKTKNLIAEQDCSHRNLDASSLVLRSKFSNIS